MSKQGSNFVKSAALSAVTGKAGDLLNKPSVDSAFSLKNFIRERDIDGTRWNKIFPYVLKIGSESGSDTKTSTITSLAKSIKSSVAKGLSSIMPKGISIGKNEVTEIILPISPSNISISTPVASNITTTLRGIVEEHNGSPLRTIRISGTTGVVPGRLTFNNPASTNSGNFFSDLGRDLFSNTIRATQSLSNEFNKPPSNALADPDLFRGESELIKNTGYYFFHQLVNFIDQYLVSKKQKSNKDKYLIFEMRKDDLYYKCSLRNFSWQKRQGTLEYDYTIELIAWAYEKKSPSTTTALLSRISNAVSTLNRVAATVKKARRVVAKAKNVIKSVNQDIDRIFLIANEMALLANETIGLPKTLMEMPLNIKKSFKNLIYQKFDFSDSNPALIELKKTSKKFAAEFLLQSQVIINQTQSGPGQVMTAKASSLIDGIFNDPTSYPEFFEEIKIDDYPVSPELQDQINAEIERVKNISSAEWITRRDEVIKFSNSLSNQIGSFSEKYNQILGVTNPQKPTRDIRLSELEILRAMTDLIESLNSIIVLSRSLDQSIQNYTEFYINLAQFNGIPLETPTGKFAVPVPYGATIQSIALQYLGDASRWPEIAALNQLRSPFIDEEGFEVKIKNETSGNIVTVSSTKNLYINQPVMVLDDVNPPISTRIKTIEIIDSITILVGLENDVTGYGQSTNARIKAYLPNTVNSNMLIYIPTQTSPNLLAEDFKFSPDISDQTVLAAMAGTDILLNSEGDIVVLPSGDVKVASGVANLAQAAKLKLVTPLGSLIQHPDYGLGVLIGNPTQDFDANKAFSDIERAFADDDRFDSVLASRVTKIGGTVSIDVVLQPPQTNSVLPISVNLRN